MNIYISSFCNSRNKWKDDIIKYFKKWDINWHDIGNLKPKNIPNKIEDDDFLYIDINNKDILEIDKDALYKIFTKFNHQVFPSFKAIKNTTDLNEKVDFFHNVNINHKKFLKCGVINSKKNLFHFLTKNEINYPIRVISLKNKKECIVDSPIHQDNIEYPIFVQEWGKFNYKFCFYFIGDILLSKKRYLNKPKKYENCNSYYRLIEDETLLIEKSEIKNIYQTLKKNEITFYKLEMVLKKDSFYISDISMDFPFYIPLVSDHLYNLENMQYMKFYYFDKSENCPIENMNLNERKSILAKKVVENFESFQ